MKVLKPFLNRGKEYRPGDTFPHDLSQAEKAHYLRYGMLADTDKPKETKPEGKPAEPSKADKPKETKPTKGPDETK